MYDINMQNNASATPAEDSLDLVSRLVGGDGRDFTAEVISRQVASLPYKELGWYVHAIAHELGAPVARDVCVDTGGTMRLVALHKFGFNPSFTELLNRHSPREMHMGSLSAPVKLVPSQGWVYLAAQDARAMVAEVLSEQAAQRHHFNELRSQEAPNA